MNLPGRLTFNTNIDTDDFELLLKTISTTVIPK